MRVPAFLVLIVGVVVVFAGVSNAADVVAFFNAQTAFTRYVLSAMAASIASIWCLVLCLSLTIDLRDVRAKIEARSGIEAGSRIRQKSVDGNDRQVALEQNISTADERRAVRNWIVMEIAFPYFILAGASSVTLLLAVQSMRVP